jgi:hypothetical protein
MLSKKELGKEILKKGNCYFIDKCSKCPFEPDCWDDQDNAVAPPTIIVKEYFKAHPSVRDDLESVIGLLGE